MTAKRSTLSQQVTTRLTMVKSGNFGHQVNSDKHLQTVEYSLGPSPNQRHTRPGTSTAQGCPLYSPKLHKTNSRMCHQHGPEPRAGVSRQHSCYTDRRFLLFRVQNSLVDVTTDYIRTNDTRSRGSQRLCGITVHAIKDVCVLILHSYFLQRLESTTYHR